MSIHIAQPGENGTGAEELELPQALPVLPLRDSVPFPDTLTPLAVGQERSVKLVNDVLAGDRMLVMVGSRDPEAENPGPDQVYRTGVAGFVARMLKVPDGSLRILVQGGQRVELIDFPATEPYMVARHRAAPGRGRAGPGARGPHPQCADHVQRDHPERPVPARGARVRSREPRGPGRAWPT